ncbi:hypothetical protein A2188_01965 [Candidatus Woesebacteria bacterium RIFOXYA1_FULL_43_9]|uniref:NodB homology domain-containing protein n=1 Tax=Candidatus Woesebacteria bacterium RIFOXYA1_FULL_43_9 TaxID=1802534 RepID=A0A1F8CN15_9BACT|nr:MAG: hypothetical protein A2188_01965 [Candidatus Woesebacteria bacterium RIFOXYA1_FULL_43_9]
MKVIFHNDDFGLTWGFTEATYQLGIKGKINSLSIRTNGVDFFRARKLSKALAKKGVRIGIHLNITDGPTCQDRLANNQGHYKYSFLHYLLLLLFPNHKLERLITNEFEQQFHMLKGVGIIQVDSHDHIHLIPRIFRITCQFCQKHHLKYIRLIKEPFLIVNKKNIHPFSYAKHLLLNLFSNLNRKVAQDYDLISVDSFYGVLYTNQMDSKVISASLKHASSKGYQTIQILSHPTLINNSHDIIYTSRFIQKYANLPNRKVEYESLLKF